MNDEETEENSQEFRQNGAIVRLKFYNFMQYGETEFLVGPNLNVIIGPNGSGKSTIVNGICIGLAGKLSVLGRATSIVEYIMVGKEEAFVEVELHMNRQKNLVIRRRWDSAAKNVWTLDGKKVSEREIKERVAKLKIQVDNLCQFLPQDKVHDFSRLNNKGLLDSTIDAVGEVRLKEKHAELKELQKELTEGSEKANRMTEILAEKRLESERLEEDVKAFKERRTLLEKIGKLGEKRLWVNYNDSKNSCRELRNHFQYYKKKWEKQEGAIVPLKKDLADAKRNKEKLQRHLQTAENTLKDLTGTARRQSQNIETANEEIIKINEDISDIDRKEQERLSAVKETERTIRELQKEMSEFSEDTDLNDKVAQIKRANQKLQEKYDAEKAKINAKKYEMRSADSEGKRIEENLNLLKNVDVQKLQLLKEKSPDAYQALTWLRNNREMFQGEVYEPFIVSGNVTDSQHAMYIENSVNFRDLTIFFFENAEDMNLFLEQTRTKQRLVKVGAAQLPAQPSSHFQPNVPAADLKELDLVAYLKDMITGPDKVISYFCKNFHLHNTPLFLREAEEHSDTIVNKFRLQRFFFGVKKQTVTRSAYSGSVTVRTTEVRQHNTLSLSLDTERIASLQREAEQQAGDIVRLRAEIEDIELNSQQTATQLEACRKQHKELERKKHLMNINTTRIDAQKQRLRELMSKTTSDREKSARQEARRRVLSDQIQSAQQLATAIHQTGQIRLEIEAKKLANRPFDIIVEEKTLAIANLREEMTELKQQLERSEEEFKESQQAMLAALKEAKAVTGLEKGSQDKPPAEVEEYWSKEKFPDTTDEIDSLTSQLEVQTASTENIDNSILEKYLRLKEDIAELEADVAKRSKNSMGMAARMEQLKTEWLDILNQLVDNIDTRFSRFFRTLGFAGEVKLSRGKHDNDFENFGLKIFVKYRDSEPLQELTPHHQSGGERSVATAIYMLSLQALTTVPFRCVDEINQGMDARNERLVFELLVHASCKENAAQYFLLTPKLLSGLDYDPRMNVLIVNNGPDMVHHSKWDIRSFHDIYARTA